jgi:ribose transport system ATP-binding protein
VIDESAVRTLAPEGGTAVQPTLSMSGITKHYNAITALRDVSFDVRPGEVHALLGENGAGKSTLVNIASGATSPDAGTIVLAGTSVEQLTPAVAQELGIAIVHQHPALLPDLTVAENIRVAVAPAHLQRRDSDTTRAMRSLLDDVHFGSHLEDRVSSLSVARRHLLELAKAFAVSPRLLILDEPTAPLSQDAVERLFAAVRKVAAEGTAVVYITHRLGEVREIAERVTVLRDGANRGTSAVKAVSDDELLALIIGRTLEATFPRKHTAESGEDTLLRVEGLSGHGFDDISLTVGKGEIVGLAGVVGNGQPAVLRALAGRAAATGTVEIGGKRFSRRSLLKNAAYMPADRLTEGLMVDLNVRENTALTALDRLTTGPFVRRSREVEAVEYELSELAVRAPSLEAPVSALSGGNQQKVALAKWLLGEPRVLLADEPTRGIDVGAKRAIYTLIHDLAANGVGVLLISSEIEELLGLAHRTLVVRAGTIVGEFPHGEATEGSVMRAAFGSAGVT